MSQRTKPLGRPSGTWEDNIKTDDTERDKYISLI
jgi:hypothetical protein